jgi:steroid delta-isomerase-like uncharacterized protein
MSRDLTAAWSSHDIERILSFYTDDCTYEDVVSGKVSHGKEELRAFVKDNFTTSPDLRLELKSVIASGDHLAIEWIMSGTQTGNLLNVPATGKSFSVRGVSVSELKDGRIQRNTDYCDGASVMRQLGLLPATTVADPFVGTWKMNLAKSRFSGFQLKRYTTTFTAQDNGIKAIEDMANADGTTLHRSWTVKYDGKDYPVTAPDLDALSIKRPEANTCEYVGKAGKSISADEWLSPRTEKP